MSDAHAYYRELRAHAEIATVAREILGDRITSESPTVLLCDCPRHESQSRASLRIDLQTSLWYCFGCAQGGDVLQLVEFVHHAVVTRDHRGSMPETHRAARDWLAERVGLPMLSEVSRTPEERADLARRRDEQDRVFGTLTRYVELAHAALMDESEVRAWISTEYGLTDETLVAQRLGYDNGRLVETMRAEGYDDAALLATGAFRVDHGGRLHPFLPKRVLIPYLSRGRAIYLTGRKTPWTEDSTYEQAKYKKLPLHDASKHPDVSPVLTNPPLFGVDILASRPTRVLWAEGITDALAAIQAGVPTISPATVRLADTHTGDVAVRLRDIEVVLVPDQDLSGVGVDGAVEIARALEERGVRSRILTLPRGDAQQAAVQQVQDLLGAERWSRFEKLPASERGRWIKDALADEERARARELAATAKVDLCAWLRDGGTPATLRTLMDGALTRLEHLIDALPESVDSAAIAALAAEIALEGDLEQHRLQLRLKEKTGIPLRVLRRDAASARSRARAETSSGTPPRASAYREAEGRLLYDKPTRDGIQTVPLTNFTARIVGHRIDDDGVETRHVYMIEAQLEDQTTTLTVPATQFDAMRWPAELGPHAIVYAGLGTKDHARVAVQSLSGPVRRTTRYTHLGWRQVRPGSWAFLHAGGAIHAPEAQEAQEALSEIEVAVGASLDGFRLPVPTAGGLRLEVLDSLLRVGPDRIVLPLLAAVMRAVLGETDFAVHLYGGSGAFKTSVAALIQSFFGRGFDDRHLPGSWISTGNALEETAFVAKDVLLVVDDYAPSGSRAHVQRLQTTAERLLRAQGNLAGRARLTADGQQRPARPPRGLVLSTGEDIPPGHSLRARLFVIEVRQGDIDKAQLTLCQREAREGVYAQVMAQIVQAMAGRLDAMRSDFRERVQAYRERTGTFPHPRTRDIAAQLQAAFDILVELLGADAEPLKHRCAAALREIADEQQHQHEQAEPVEVFLEQMRAALLARGAHIADLDGCRPREHAEALGWGQDATVPSHCLCVGWTDGKDLYLVPTLAIRAVEAIASATQGLHLTALTLGRGLDDRGLLIRPTSTRRARLTVQRTLGGTKRDVLHLHLDTVLAPSSSRAPLAPLPPPDSFPAACAPDSGDAGEGADRGTDVASASPQRLSKRREPRLPSPAEAVEAQEALFGTPPGAPL